MIYIDSPKNEHIKKIKKLRSEEDFYWWEGTKFFYEILKEKETVSLLVLTNKLYETLKNKLNIIGIDKIYIVKEDIFKKISYTITPQGIGGIMKKKIYTLSQILSKEGPIFFLDGLQDPGNVGTIVRIADAFNFSGILYRKTGVSPYHEKAVRSSTGSILRVPCYSMNDDELKNLKGNNRPLFFLEPDLESTQKIQDLSKEELKKGIFFLGREGSGFEIQIEGAKKIYIPMSKRVDSLNVAVTAGIVGFLAGDNN
ncbi:MAG: RNA methyltransferase [Proteobacteria bacterium]|nr:RNA methyltransferase [Pseudomonadota bacterium]